VVGVWFGDVVVGVELEFDYFVDFGVFGG